MRNWKSNYRFQILCKKLLDFVHRRRSTERDQYDRIEKAYA